MNSLSTSIGLYIHIPFCSSKCKYCDFYSETTGFDRITKVVKELVAQLKYHYKRLGSPKINTVFIGGGTPSLIPADELKYLLKSVGELAENPVEWSIESNPESITKEFLQICSDYGVGRLSIGIQSFNNRLLKILGRKTDYNQIVKGLDLVKKYWGGSINLDLISSIPGQSEEMIIDDINKALSYNPEHISFYSLSIEEGTDLEDEISKGIIQELTDTESELIWLKGREILLNTGYNNYEISNYTKNSPCLHNLNYWELKPYLGIGPGAVSTLLESDGVIKRVTNSKSISDFIAGQKSNWGESSEVISPKEFLTDYIIMGLRLKKGIDKARFKSIFKCDIETVISITPDLIDEGSIESSITHYKLTQTGFDIMNNVCVKILESLENIEIKSAHWFY